MTRQRRQHDEPHLHFIRLLPCLICGDDTCTEAAHIRYGDRTAGKRQTGLGERPDDCFTLPLCSVHHRAQHTENEKRWWTDLGIDPIRIALSLWRVSGNCERGVEIIKANLE